METITTDAQLVDYVAAHESEKDYAKWNPNDNGAGVSFGFIQFNQKKGSLPKLLREMDKADGNLFMECFGGRYRDVFQNEANIRRMDLNRPEMKAKILSTAKHEVFRQVQRKLAIDDYLRPAEKALRDLAKYLPRGARASVKARAMAFDISVQYGVGGLRSRIIEARKNTGHELEFLNRLAKLSDTHGYDNNRRTQMLRDPRLPIVA